MSPDADAAWVAIGVVGRPHGRDGAFVVEQASDAPGRFDVGAEVYVERRPVRVISTKRAGGRIVVALSETCRQGVRLELPRSLLPSLGEDEYYVFDLVGLDVVTDADAEVGRIADVLPRPANDVIELESGGLLPLVRACVLEVDVARGRVVIARSFAPDG